jgi:homoserine dehydrogenase
MKTGVALLGCGTVGAAVAQMLLNEKEHLLRRTGQSLELRRVLVRDIHKRRDGIPKSLLTTAPADIWRDESIRVVVELIGGLEPAQSLIFEALAAGKRVVTANKHLLATHGTKIFQAAARAGSCVSFEASCGGAIPIVLALTRGLIANDIDRLIGIVNGTCNYILTQMNAGNQTYVQALAGAQAAGFAEADPAMDVRGMDSAHKLAVLAALAFGIDVPPEKIDVTGIDSLQDTDLRYGRELGYVCKLLAIAEKFQKGISLRVHPAFLPIRHLLANVNGPFNAIDVYGHASGQTIYYGRGAGGRPTAGAVIADIVDAAMGTAELLFRHSPLLTRRRKATLLPTRKILCRQYLRMNALDRPGVMHRITGVLGRNGISLAAVVQHESRAGDYVPLVVMTHAARDGAVDRAVTQIDRLSCVRGKTARIRVMDPGA